MSMMVLLSARVVFPGDRTSDGGLASASKSHIARKCTSRPACQPMPLFPEEGQRGSLEGK